MTPATEDTGVGDASEVAEVGDAGDEAQPAAAEPAAVEPVEVAPAEVAPVVVAPVEVEPVEAASAVAAPVSAAVAATPAAAVSPDTPFVQALRDAAIAELNPWFAHVGNEARDIARKAAADGALFTARVMVNANDEAAKGSMRAVFNTSLSGLSSIQVEARQRANAALAKIMQTTISVLVAAI